jgi:hypothetical protein
MKTILGSTCRSSIVAKAVPEKVEEWCGWPSHLPDEVDRAPLLFFLFARRVAPLSTCFFLLEKDRSPTTCKRDTM